MKTISDLCDIVRQTAYDIHFGSYRFQIRKYVLSQGKVSEEGSDRLACLMPFLFALSVFFRG